MERISPRPGVINSNPVVLRAIHKKDPRRERYKKSAARRATVKAAYFRWNQRRISSPEYIAKRDLAERIRRLKAENRREQRGGRVRRPIQTPEERRYFAAKYGCSRRKKKRVLWLISLDDFKRLCARECWYCGGVFGKVVHGIGLDRIDSGGHYSMDNVVSCCRICNRVKGDNFTMGEAKKMIELALQMKATPEAVR